MLFSGWPTFKKGGEKKYSVGVTMCFWGELHGLIFTISACHLRDLWFKSYKVIVTRQTTMCFCMS